MTFTVLPGATRIDHLLRTMAQGFPEAGRKLRPELTPPANSCGGGFDPLYDERHAVMAMWDSANDLIVKALRNGLEAHNGHLVLVADTLPAKAVSHAVLDHIPRAHLRYGIFTALDYRLEALRPYEGAAIFVPDKFGAKVLKSAPCSSPPGRPHHPGKAWYQAQGFDRAGRSISQLQREMFADGIEPPSESTIRSWEADATREKSRQKPGPKNIG